MRDCQHYPILESVLGSALAAKESLVHSYGRSFNGFAAKLSDEEVARLSNMEGVVSVLPNQNLQLQTTKSWDFLGFTPSFGLGTDSTGGDVIIGMIDSGIWPEAESFNDEGFGPPPAKWKGTCQTKSNFTCNNKIIGARYYGIEGNRDTEGNHEYPSPRDSQGHGTYTASIAAGREVKGASYFGQGLGLMRGGAPNARIAVYKVCSYGGCSSANIVAALDEAIADGVDIILTPIRWDCRDILEYANDPVTIGSFHASRKGILTVAPAGNDGPYRASVTNYAPSLLTGGASTIDRKFVSKLVLADGKIFEGNAIHSFDLNGIMFPSIWGGDSTNFSGNAYPESASHCSASTLDSQKVKGKIVLCEGFSSDGVEEADGVGAIMTAIDLDDTAPFSFPVTLLSEEEIAQVLAYIKSSENTEATILVSGAMKDFNAPEVAPFSGKGPGLLSPDILKPDLTAPGVNILAAWSPIGLQLSSQRSTPYSIRSGTSAATVHIAGAAAFVKANHPSWSAAAIKSALMTTANAMEPTKHQLENEFAYGSGLLNPTKAVDPGLVYDASDKDYVEFLCKQGFNTTLLRLVTGNKSVRKNTKPGRGWDLNYPSFMQPVQDGHKISGNLVRIVTNVGSPNSTYHVSIDKPDFVDVKVDPSVLTFATVGEEKSFVVSVNGPNISQVPIISCTVTWEDGVHLVRAPLVIYT